MTFPVQNTAVISQNYRMILMSKEALQVILRKNNEMENFLIATTFL
jgi:hypothetical protein